LTFNWIVGAGIFAVPSKVYALTGTYSLFAFATCALFAVLISFCFAEVSSRFTETGGPYLYAHTAFGSIVGFEVGWLLWMTRLATSAAICNVIVNYLSYFWAPLGSGLWRTGIITVAVVTLTLTNIIGVGRAAVLGDILTVGKLVPLLLFVAVGLFFINRHSYSLAAAPPMGSFSLAVSQLIFAFSGFEMAVVTAGETRNPQRNIPFALLTAIGAVSLLYMLIQVVCIGTLPQLASSEKPLADATNLFIGPAGAAIITLGMLVSGLGTLNANLLAGPRLPFAMAEEDQLPRILSGTHPRYHTPHIAILITASLILLLALSGTFTQMVILSSISKLLTFVATCAALPVLRRRHSGSSATFRLPAGITLSVISTTICLWLLANSGWAELRFVGVTGAAGLLFHIFYSLRQRRLTKGSNRDEAQLS
jgi:amino acid transporter